MEDYVEVRSDRNRHEGDRSGVACYIRSGTSFNLSTDSVADIKNILMGIVYRPPDQAF